MTKQNHILYLNNDLVFARRTKTHLEDDECSVALLSVQEFPLHKIKNTKFDVIVLDLPYSDALKFLSNKEIKEYLSVCVLILDNGIDSIVNDANKLGCKHFVNKENDNYINLLVVTIKNILEQSNQVKVLQHDLEICELTAKRVQSTAKVGNWQYYPGSNVAEWSPQEFINFGFSPDSVIPTYDKYIDAVHPDDRKRVKQFNLDCLTNHVPTEFVFRLLLDGVQTRYIHAITEIDTNEQGDVVRIFGVSQDITEQKLIEARLQQAATVYETTTEAIFVTNTDNLIISINAAFTTITGYTEQQVIGHTPNILASGYHDAHFFHEFWDELKQNGCWQGEVWNRHLDGHIFPTWQSITVITDPEGNTIQYVSIFSDITKRKAQDELIHYQANYDSLTELPNRHLFHDRIELAINQATRANSRVALMLMDLDRFKWINDTLGHRAGDLLLIETAKRLKSATRRSDTVSRMGGDEFTVILTELDSGMDAERIAEKIFTALAKPVEIEGNEVIISASIGISIFPDDGGDSQTLQKNADSAMYSAKEAGRNCYHYFTPLLQAKSERRIRLIQYLRTAIEHNEFSIVYQPIMDITCNKIVSAEALIRWTHAEFGSVSPAEFIPIAEESGLIREIGHWVVKRVAKDMQDWQKAGLAPLRISINKSPKQFSYGDCDEDWNTVFSHYGIPLSLITVEITETVFMDKQQYCVDSLVKMQNRGIKVSLDDFGTGYSSLSYLKRFPVDILKIDREFINDLATDPSDALLVETILTLAEKMKISVIAEGVETQAQLDFLQQHQCQYVQGYFFSKPLVVKEFIQFLRAH